MGWPQTEVKEEGAEEHEKNEKDANEENLMEGENW
jgi:hypothetical protein